MYPTECTEGIEIDLNHVRNTPIGGGYIYGLVYAVTALYNDLLYKSVQIVSTCTLDNGKTLLPTDKYNNLAEPAGEPA